MSASGRPIPSETTSRSCLSAGQDETTLQRFPLVQRQVAPLLSWRHKVHYNQFAFIVNLPRSDWIDPDSLAHRHNMTALGWEQNRTR